MIGQIGQNCVKYNPLFLAHQGLVHLEKNQEKKIMAIFISALNAASAYVSLRAGAILGIPVAHFFTIISPLEAAIAIFAISYIVLAIIFGISTLGKHLRQN